MIAPHTPEEAATGQACAQVLATQWWVGGKPVADFCGMQDDGNGGQFALWNLLVPCGPHPVGSTVVA